MRPEREWTLHERSLDMLRANEVFAGGRTSLAQTTAKTTASLASLLLAGVTLGLTSSHGRPAVSQGASSAWGIAMDVKQKGSPRISPDPDLPELTDDWIAGAYLYHGEKLVRRGRPKLEKPRQLLSLRLPPQTIARWKASGPGWQTRMAEALGKSAPKARAAG